MTARFHSLALLAAAALSAASFAPQHLRATTDGAHLRDSGMLHVPGDFATIQAAIDAAGNGDTVLVSEGTYTENIRYRGKAIVVASLYAIDKDTTHIARTIIDGSASTNADSGSVVYFIDGEDTTSVLCGFTIQGGSGTYTYYSCPNLYYSRLDTYWIRAGGGVFCDRSGGRLVRNYISGNRIAAQAAGGGGMWAHGTKSSLPYVILEGNRVSDNLARSDTIEQVFTYGGGAYLVLTNARIVGNIFERDSAVSRVGSDAGGLGIRAPDATAASLPAAYIAENVFRSNVAFSTGGGAPNGAMAGGLSLCGTGEVTVTDNLFESNYAVAKDNWHQLASGGGISIIDGGFPMHGRKMVLNNQFINNVVYAGTATWGGGIKAEHTLVTVRGNTFTHNRAELAYEVQYGGGAMWMGWCGFLVENNIFDGNYSSYEGGALAIRGDPTVGREEAIINNTFVGNQAVSRGAGVRAELASCLALVNNIFWDDTSSGGGELCIFDAIAGVAYCDVKGGYEGTGNINVDPAFMPGDSLYRLTASSPCIEGGTDSIQLGTLWFRAPPKDYDALLRPMPAGTRPDIGAHEEQLSMVAYARDAIVNPCTAKPQIDTVHIRATVVNPHEHSLDVTALAEELSSGNVQDSILLQDDGLHDDGLANDGTWGGIFVPTMEGVFSLDVRTVDAIAGTSRELQHAAAFATAGPLAYVGYRFYQQSVDTIAAPGADLYLHIGVRNLGASCPITGVRGYVSAVDSLVDYVIMPSVTWGTVFPGDTTHYSSTFINVTLGPGRVGGSEASFALQLSSNGYPFWQDTIRFVLTAVEGAEGLLPPYYVLAQNYPNPFNPSTTIRYGLPVRSHVTLTVFNALGQQVATIVQGEQEAGFHEVQFDASGLASGVYLYRLIAGSFVQTRRLLSLR